MRLQNSVHADYIESEDELTNHAREPSDQQQSQTQALNLTLNLGRNTNDPAFEEQVFNEMYSAGSQIGRMAALLEVLLKA